jgi:hypothetical protein
MTEAQLQRKILDLCAYLHLRVFHSTDSRRDTSAGFPDLVIVGPGGIVYAELKSQRGRVKPEQFAWLEALSQHALALVWRPSDWTFIEATLKELARPKP